MKLIAGLILMIISFELNAQNGYVKLLKNDSVIVGYLRHFISDKDGRSAMEVWRTKRDNNPMHFYKSDLIEYAIKKDTFRVLQNFKPFEDEKTYFNLTDALFISQGKINLLRIELNSHNSFGVGSNGTYVSVGYGDVIYILEDNETKYRRAISDEEEKMKEQLLDFFTESYLKKYEQFKKKIKYKTIPDLVKLYNSK